VVVRVVVEKEVEVNGQNLVDKTVDVVKLVAVPACVTVETNVV
jgi:hypothetical protein